MMKIYFACSISGGRKDEKAYQYLVQVLTGMGIDVPTAHIAETGVEEVDAREKPGDIYNRDVSWIRESDLLIAEVSTPSHGVGYEIGYALDMGKPVLCLYKKGVVISKMITGNPHPLLTVIDYENNTKAEEILRTYLAAYE
ncbi:MAG: nucleoside 2-deoxyribosyltransferase [Anaerolineales bacterium]|nr:nucleoside 2-deoxyribosyltransferase [Anaerolineales bacterium]